MKQSTFSRLSTQNKVAAAMLALVALLLGIAVVSSLLGSCVAPGGGAAAKPSGKPQSGLPSATLRSGSVEMIVELAVTPAEQETGLMHRTELEDGRGMLFVYTEDRRLSYWMKNTVIPLSIAYLGSDGSIKEIYDMEPLSLAPVLSERYVRYALEAPLGWFARAGLGVGDRFDLSEVAGRR